MKFSQGLLMLFFKMWISLQTCSQYSTYLYSQDLTSNYGTWTKLIKVPICKWGIFFNIFIFWTAINLVFWLLQTTLSNINSVILCIVLNVRSSWVTLYEYVCFLWFSFLITEKRSLLIEEISVNTLDNHSQYFLPAYKCPYLEKKAHFRANLSVF